MDTSLLTVNSPQAQKTQDMFSQAKEKDDSARTPISPPPPAVDKVTLDAQQRAAEQKDLTYEHLQEQSRKTEEQEASFLTKALDVMLGNSLGMDSEALAELDEKIEALQGKDKLTSDEKDQLETLLSQKESLVAEASERLTGDEQVALLDE